MRAHAWNYKSGERHVGDMFAHAHALTHIQPEACRHALGTGISMQIPGRA